MISPEHEQSATVRSSIGTPEVVWYVVEHTRTHTHRHTHTNSFETGNILRSC